MGVKHAMGSGNSSCFYCERVVGSCAFIPHPTVVRKLITLRNNYFIPNSLAKPLRPLRELDISYTARFISSSLGH